MRSTADARVAVRQAATISAVSAAVSVLALMDTRFPPAAVAGVAAGQLALAALLAVLPVDRWAPEVAGRACLAAGLTMFVLLGLTAWVSDGYASGTGPLYVLVFAWFGLHLPPRLLVAAVAWAAVTYAGGLVLADARPRLVLSTVVLIPIATLVALLIANRVAAGRRLRDDLEVRERWRGALMATLAHDVRSPLATVSGTLELLEDDPTLDGYRSLVQAATRQTQRVLRLATGILEVERVEHGALVLDCVDVSLVAVADEVAALTRPGDVEVEVDPSITVPGDAQRLEQVLFNLTNNALRHGRPPVVIGATRHAGTVEVAVEDHGAGVPPREVPHLFDRFSTADHSPGSVGLGLWIVRTLVEAHGGSVRYEAPRGGARFVVTLPAADAASPRPVDAGQGLDGLG